MSEPHPRRSPSAAPAAAGDRRSLFERFVEFLMPGPDSRHELFATLADAESRELIAPESRAMLEGVIRMADLRAGDVMVPAPRMDLVDLDAPYDELLAHVIASGHSRFPAYDRGAAVADPDDGREPRDRIVGILLSKDLLKRQRSPELHLRALLRPAVFVPETKSLNDLLRDFRTHRNHLAIVVDEFGAVAGLVTIEDVLEEIVGEIEDEFDDDAADDAAAATGVVTLADGARRVAGDATIAAVNGVFGTALPEVDFETIGGLVAHELGRVPRRGESVALGGLRLTVMLTRGGAVRWFRAEPVAPDADG